MPPLTYAGYDLPIDNGHLTIEHDPMFCQVKVRDISGQVIGIVDDQQWAEMGDAQKRVTVMRFFDERDRRRREVQLQPNTQGVLNFLADIGRRWAAA